MAEYQKAAILVDGELKYKVNWILKQCHTKKGDLQYLVEWMGWPKPTWEPASSMVDTAALDEWEQHGRAGAGGGE